MDVEAQSLREELQLGREKYDTLLETNKHLEFSMKSSKHQFEREIRELQMANKNEVLALNERMESTMKAMHTQHERELNQLRTQHKQEVESAGQVKLDSVKSKVESYVAELTMEKQILQDTIVDRDVEIDGLKRQVDLANLEIGRLNGLVLMDVAHKASPKVRFPSESISLSSGSSSSSYSFHNRSMSNTLTPEARSMAAIRTSPPLSTPPLYQQPISPPQQQHHQHHQQQSQMTVEEVSIAAKIKDPDQEALAAGILLSSQDARFGTNMFDSLTEDDNAVIEEYIKQGFTRYLK